VNDEGKKCGSAWSYFSMGYWPALIYNSQRVYFLLADGSPNDVWVSMDVVARVSIPKDKNDRDRIGPER
jgi:hypothetical protein